MGMVLIFSASPLSPYLLNGNHTHYGMVSIFGVSPTTFLSNIEKCVFDIYLVLYKVNNNFY